MSTARYNTGIQWVSDHARDRWRDRSDRPGANLHAIWHEATPIDYSRAYQDAYARYHPETDLILLARWGELVTVVSLSDHPVREQQFVKDQLEG